MSAPAAAAGGWKGLRGRGRGGAFAFSAGKRQAGGRRPGIPDAQAPRHLSAGAEWRALISSQSAGTLPAARAQPSRAQRSAAHARTYAHTHAHANGAPVRTRLCRRPHRPRRPLRLDAPSSGSISRARAWVPCGPAGRALALVPHDGGAAAAPAPSPAPAPHARPPGHHLARPALHHRHAGGRAGQPRQLPVPGDLRVQPGVRLQRRHLQQPRQATLRAALRIRSEAGALWPVPTYHSRTTQIIAPPPRVAAMTAGLQSGRKSPEAMEDALHLQSFVIV